MLHTHPDPSRPSAPPATELCRGVMRLFSAMDSPCITEMTLANGRRADIVAIDPKGHITIVEVKSCRNDFNTDQKWPEYLPFCDRFYFAVADSFPIDILPPDTGLIIADGFGAGVVRETADHPLSAARRKAVTIRFARHAANQLTASHLSPVDAGTHLL